MHFAAICRLRIAFAFFSLLIGALVGLRFRFLILVPVAMVALVFVMGVDVAREAGVWWIVLDMVVASISLQLGYFAGCTLRAFVSLPAPEHSYANPPMNMSLDA
jgi:hypothetical protein